MAQVSFTIFERYTKHSKSLMVISLAKPDSKFIQTIHETGMGDRVIQNMVKIIRF